VIAVLALLVLIGSLLGLGLTLYWYWAEIHAKDDATMVNKVKGGLKTLQQKICISSFVPSKNKLIRFTLPRAQMGPRAASN
jgi:hypothetical protein